jgi:WD40 repeat protein
MNNNNNFDISNIYLENTIKINTQSIYCLLILNDGRICSASNDSKINILNKFTYETEITIDIFQNGIYYISQLKNLNLICCSEKIIKIIKILDKNKKSNKLFEVIQTLSKHSNKIWKVIELSDNNLISCSSDKTIIIWENNNNFYKFKYFIPIIADSVRSIIENKINEIAYTSFYEQKLYFYNTKTRNQIKILTKIFSSGWNNDIFYYNENYIFVGGNLNIYLINIKKYLIINSFETDNYILSFLLMGNNYLLTGDNKGNIYQWMFNEKEENLSLMSKKIEKSLNNLEKSIYNIKLIDNNRLITASEDSTIKIWKF